MNIRTILCLIAVEFLEAMAQPDISYSNTVSSFLENRKTYTAYRTKQLDEKKQIDGKKSNVLSTVQKNMSAQALKSFEKVLQQKKFKTKIKENSEIHAWPQNKLIVDLSCLDGEEYHCGQKILNNIFPREIASEFDFQYTSLEYVESKGNRLLDSYILSYKRVFENRIVCGPSNTLEIYVNADGSVSYIEISAEDLILTERKIFLNDDMYTNKTALKEVVEKDFSKVVSIDRENSYIKVEKVMVNGVTEAFCPVNFSNDHLEYFPCLSYSVDILLESGQNFQSVIHAPHSLTSWDEYKK